MDTRKIGSLGERLSKKWLQNKGYTIIARNWYCHWGELDLVCSHPKRGLVFVEVKYVQNSHFIYPEELFTRKKRLHLLRTINIYLARHPAVQEWCVDLVCLVKKGSKVGVRHFKSVSLS